MQNNVFSNVWQAVYIWHSSGNTIEDNTIEALGNTGHWAGISIYDGYISDQINLGFPSKNNVIQRNTLVDKGISVGAWQPPVPTDNSGTKIVGNTVMGSIGFYYTASSGVEISGNTLPGPNAGQILFDGASSFTSCVVSDNTVGAGTTNGIQLSFMTGGSVSDNDVSYRTANGIALLSSSNVDIVGNTTADNGASGIVLGGAGSSGNDVMGNEILRNAGNPGNPGGLTIKGGVGSTTVLNNTINNNTQYGVWIDSTAGTGNVFHLNNIVANGVGMKNNTVPTADAEDNWWGTLSWYGYDAVPGIKDRVSGNVDWEPWKGSSLTTSYSKPTTTYVDDDNVGMSEGQSGSSGGVFGYDAFAVIQDGINNVASSTVNVAAGTYTEQLDIGKPLTLTGAGQASTIIKSPAVLATKFVTGTDNNKPVVYIHDATGVTVQQLTVDGDGKGNTNYRMQGIAFYKAGGTVDHVTITRVRDTPLTGAQHGVTLYASNADGAPRTINISNNTIGEYQKNGMALIGAGLTATVTGNTVTGSGPTGVIAQNGIQVSDEATGTVDGNTVSNNSYTGSTGAPPMCWLTPPTSASPATT